MRRTRAMLPAALSYACLVGLVGAADIPEALKPPTPVSLIFQVHAKGDQIYACREQWTLQGPEASLFDADGKPAGKHFAGPVWQALDGSRVKGKVIASVGAPEDASIPWLLLEVISHEGEGAMALVSAIQRLNTSGGLAPTTSCDSASAGKLFRSPYEADYLFYGETPPTP